jgi:hypothetical protein
MTSIFRFSNLFAGRKKAESASPLGAYRAPMPRSTDRIAAEAEDFSYRVAADAWLFACNHRILR